MNGLVFHQQKSEDGERLSDCFLMACRCGVQAGCFGKTGSLVIHQNTAIAGKCKDPPAPEKW